MSRVRSGFALVLGAVALAACGDDGITDPGEQREVLANPSFAADINPIFERRGCSTGSCHGGGAGGLTFTGSASGNHGRLVGVQALGESFLLVAPGDAQNSYLVIKIEGRQTSGTRMPRGGNPLDGIDQANIRNWIDNGAQNN